MGDQELTPRQARQRWHDIHKPRVLLVHVILIAAAPVLLLWAHFDTFAYSSHAEMARLSVEIQKLADLYAGPFGLSDAEQAAQADAVVYVNPKHGFRVVTTQACVGQFAVGQRNEKFDTGPEAYFDVTLQASEGWKKDTTWFSYAAYSQEAYDDISEEELPGKPNIVLTLGNGKLLTQYGPQESPPDLGDCLIWVDSNM